MAPTILKIISMPIAKLRHHPKNPRIHPEDNLSGIMNSLDKFGQRAPLVIWGVHNYVIIGNGRLESMKRLGWKSVQVHRADDLSNDEALAFCVADNKSGDTSYFDPQALMSLMDSFKEGGADVSLTGFTPTEVKDLFAENAYTDTPTPGILRKDYIEPPFSVLSARGGEWQDRKRE